MSNLQLKADSAEHAGVKEALALVKQGLALLSQIDQPMVKTVVSMLSAAIAFAEMFLG